MKVVREGMHPFHLYIVHSCRAWTRTHAGNESVHILPVSLSGNLDGTIWNWRCTVGSTIRSNYLFLLKELVLHRGKSVCTTLQNQSRELLEAA
jgi:hypothetical protein